MVLIGRGPDPGESESPEPAPVAPMPSPEVPAQPGPPSQVPAQPGPPSQVPAQPGPPSPEPAQGPAAAGHPDEPTAPEPVVTPTKSRGRFTLPGGPLLPLGAVIVLGIVAAGIIVTTGFKHKPVSNTTTTTAAGADTTTKATVPLSKVPLTTVTNSADGFSISYPSTWEQVPDSTAPLLVVDPKTKNGFDVEVYQLARPVDTGNISEIKKVTDTILAGAAIRMVTEKPITLNGLPGYYYFYLYKDPSTGLVGANSQEFVFQGRKLTDITFQALPYTNFGPLGATFDKIANSYKSNPNVLGPVPPVPTTVARSTATTTRSATTTQGTTKVTTKKA